MLLYPSPLRLLKSKSQKYTHAMIPDISESAMAQVVGLLCNCNVNKEVILSNFMNVSCVVEMNRREVSSFIKL